MNKEASKKHNNDILNLLSVTISICALILITLATIFNVYSYSISKDEKELITNKNIVVDFTSGNKVILKNLRPGDFLEYNFSISSKEDATSMSYYDIHFDVAVNDFNSELLTYRIESASSLTKDTGTLVKLPDTNFVDYDNPHYRGSIKPGEVQNYKLVLYYSSSSTNKKNNLEGEIKVDVAKNEE